MKKRIHAFFSGMVQGVGFRFTARLIANHFGITGWVRNAKDGRVEIVAEADEPTLKKLLSRINEDMEDYVKGADVDWQEATGEFDSFDIAPS